MKTENDEDSTVGAGGSPRRKHLGHTSAKHVSYLVSIAYHVLLSYLISLLSRFAVSFIGPESRFRPLQAASLPTTSLDALKFPLAWAEFPDRQPAPATATSPSLAAAMGTVLVWLADAAALAAGAARFAGAAALYALLAGFYLVTELRARHNSLLLSVFVLGGFNRQGDRVAFRFTSALAAFTFLGFYHWSFRLGGDCLWVVAVLAGLPQLLREIERKADLLAPRLLALLGDVKDQ